MVQELWKTEHEEFRKGVTELVKQRRRDPLHAELELRLGAYVDGHFTSGVTRTVFHQLEQDMLKDPNLVGDPHWVEVVDYFYSTKKHDRIRTRVEYDSATMSMSTTHTCKQRQQNVIGRWLQCSSEEACRVVVSSEIPVTDVPETCVTTFVRIKQRRQFRDVRDGKVVWLYDLSRTWSAPSRSAVEYVQQTQEPTYEVECELLDEGGSYLKGKTNEQVCASVLYKIAMLLGAGDQAASQICSALVK